MDARDAVIAAYQARRLALQAEARIDDRNHRPLNAILKRHTARILWMAALSEEINTPPLGIGRFS